MGISAKQLDAVRADFIDSLADLLPEVTALPGALALLQHLRLHNIPVVFVAGATSTCVGRLATGAHMALLELGQAVVCAEGGVRARPFPDMYLKAARLLNVSPQVCILKRLLKHTCVP